MTREEKEIAIFCLKASSDYHSEVCEECVKYPNCDHTIQDDVTETIIKALEQEPCEDAVSRDMALEKMADYVSSGYADSVEDFEEYSRIICQLPPVTPQTKTGHWEWVQYDYNPNIGNWHCSKCKNIAVVGVNKNEEGGIPIYKYCPNCGAKMVDPQESEKIDCKFTN